MNKQLELEQGAKYARLGRNGKVYYITESEAMAEEVLTTPEDTVRDSLVGEANLIKERVGIIHKMMWEDEQRPSQYQADYDMLWYRYQEIVYQLREIDPESVDRFRDELVARVKELEVRYAAVRDARNPDDFDDFERLVALYEKLHDHHLLRKDHPVHIPSKPAPVGAK
ncbi:unnamed protein product [marine sediment metagenome]|uniref:Uncharacterized protein n=1 Tax=marine sediment metagenome TaxID=412755 RepID=X1RKN7_9ZZZZ